MKTDQYPWFLDNIHLPEDYVFDLQRFASPEDEGRTEEPSEIKKRKAREEGNIPQSQELIGIIVFLGIFFGITAFWRYFYSRLFELIQYYINGINSIQLSKNNIQALSINFIIQIMQVLGPILGIGTLFALAVSLAQTRFLFTTKKLSPNFSKIFGNMLSNLKKMFWSKQALFNLGKSLMKVIAVFGIAFLFAVNDLPTMIAYVRMEHNTAFGMLAGLIVRFVAVSGALLFIFAIADYVFQYREYIDSLKMTKQEVKDEFKETEGNPEIKQKIRQLEQQMGMRRMLTAVPAADVIITNPTHYSVAIKYDSSYMNAPIVVAKGVDRTALRIREIAQEHSVPIHENKPLARGLYAMAEVGDEIPVEFYRTVADILTLVYSTRSQTQTL